MSRAKQLAAVAQNRNADDVRLRVIDRANAGMSYTQIAADLSITKGVISGIVYRARKAGMVFPTTRAARPQDRPKPKPRPAAVAPLRVVKVAPVSDEPLYLPARITLMQIRDGLCRFPLWGKLTPPSQKFYCGNPSDAGSVYCSHCRAIAVAPKAADKPVKKTFSMKRRLAA